MYLHIYGPTTEWITLAKLPTIIDTGLLKPQTDANSIVGWAWECIGMPIRCLINTITIDDPYMKLFADLLITNNNSIRFQLLWNYLCALSSLFWTVYIITTMLEYIDHPYILIIGHAVIRISMHILWRWMYPTWCGGGLYFLWNWDSTQHTCLILEYWPSCHKWDFVK